MLLLHIFASTLLGITDKMIYCANKQ